MILNLKQIYYLEVLIKKYDELKWMYTNKNSVIRNKSLTLTRYKLVMGQKNYNNDAIIILNKLPRYLKNLKFRLSKIN